MALFYHKPQNDILKLHPDKPWMQTLFMPAHKKKNAWNTVTPLSKTMALIMFVTFPFIGFYFGTQYQRALDKPYMIQKSIDRSTPINLDGVACTMEAKLCPDGTTYVGRSGPSCEFEKCPGE